MSGYSIEDILLQDALLDAVEDAVLDVVVAPAELMPVLVVGAPLRYRHRIYNTAVVVHRGRVLGVVPKSYLPTSRSSTNADSSPPATICTAPSGWATWMCRSDPACFSPRPTCPASCCTSRSARDMFVPVPPVQAALAGATVLANLSGSPITIGRAEDRCLLARSASSRCLAAYVYAAAGEGESTTDLAWDGQTMIWENGVYLVQSERLPKGERRSIADAGLELLRSERLRMGIFDDNRRHHRITEDSLRRVESALDPPAGDIGLLREVERFRFVPADPHGCNRIATRRTTGSRSPVWSSGCALNYPKMELGLSGGLDSTHALIVAARDGSRRPTAQRSALSVLITTSIGAPSP